MARFLIATIPIIGHVSPAIPIVRELVNRGARVGDVLDEQTVQRILEEIQQVCQDIKQTLTILGIFKTLTEKYCLVSSSQVYGLGLNISLAFSQANQD